MILASNPDRAVTVKERARRSEWRAQRAALYPKKQEDLGNFPYSPPALGYNVACAKVAELADAPDLGSGG